MNKEEGIVVALVLLAIAIKGKFKRVFKVAFNPEMRGFTVILGFVNTVIALCHDS